MVHDADRREMAAVRVRNASRMDESERARLVMLSKLRSYRCSLISRTLNGR